MYFLNMIGALAGILSAEQVGFPQTLSTIEAETLSAEEIGTRILPQGYPRMVKVVRPFGMARSVSLKSITLTSKPSVSDDPEYCEVNVFVVKFSPALNSSGEDPRAVQVEPFSRKMYRSFKRSNYKSCPQVETEHYAISELDQPIGTVANLLIAVIKETRGYACKADSPKIYSCPRQRRLKLSFDNLRDVKKDKCKFDSEGSCFVATFTEYGLENPFFSEVKFGVPIGKTNVSTRPELISVNSYNIISN